jgi:hypothetical protein
MMGTTARVMGFALFALAGLAGCSAGDPSSESDELSSQDTEEVGEVDQSLDFDLDITIPFLPTQCCLLKFSNGNYTCGQTNATEAWMERKCKSERGDRGAVSWDVKGGACSTHEECPNYEPPPVSTPTTPRPPGQCPTGQQCCEPLPGDRCVLCKANLALCP